VPLAAPGAVGAKIALKAALPPGFSVTGRLGPLKVNPLPVTLALDRVTASPPVFVTETAMVLLVPTVTFPKLTLAGLALNDPGPTPVPDKGISNGEFDASDVMVKVPLDELAATGLKVTLNETLWFGLSVTGSVNPLLENPAPVMLSCDMVTVDPPVLVKVSDSVELWPN